MRLFMKALHELGAIGVMGALAAILVLAATAPTDSLVAYAAVRAGIAAVAEWLLVPSLLVVLASGLLSIALVEAYKNAGWAWVKALLGIVMFEGTLLTVGAGARRAAELSALAAAGQPTAAELAQIVRSEWGSLWLLMAISLANVVLGVWRPRFTRRRNAEPTTAESTDAA